MYVVGARSRYLSFRRLSSFQVMDDQQRPPPSVSAAELGKPPGKLPRQGPGLARVGYRNKKVKCEGKQPKCGSCAMLDVECVRSTTNLPRGPRKGHLKVLQSRLGT